MTKKGDNQELLFLRRHNPDQVQRVPLRLTKINRPLGICIVTWSSTVTTSVSSLILIYQASM